MAAYNSNTALALGQITEVEDPELYRAFLDIHNAIGHIITELSDVDTGVEARVTQNTLNIVSNATSIANNIASITNNAAGIITNAANITNNASAITILQTAVANLTASVNSLSIYIAARKSIQTKDADYSLLVTDGTILIDASTAAVTITLLTAVSNSGKRFDLKCIDDTNTVLIDPAGVETLDGAAGSFQLYKDESLTIQSDGVSWYIL